MKITNEVVGDPNDPKYRCHVTKDIEDGKTVFKVVLDDSNFWLATFFDEDSAEAFAREYPALRAKYELDSINANPTVEADEENDSAEDEAPYSIKDIVDIHKSAHWIYTENGNYGTYENLMAAAGKRKGGCLAYLKLASKTNEGGYFYVIYSEFKEAWGWRACLVMDNRMTMLSDKSVMTLFDFDIRKFLKSNKMFMKFKGIVKDVVTKNLTNRAKLQKFYMSLKDKPADSVQNYYKWFDRALKFIDRTKIDVYHDDRDYTFTLD